MPRKVELCVEFLFKIHINCQFLLILFHFVFRFSFRQGTKIKRLHTTNSNLLLMLCWCKVPITFFNEQNRVFVCGFRIIIIINLRINWFLWQNLCLIALNTCKYNRNQLKYLCDHMRNEQRWRWEMCFALANGEKKNNKEIINKTVLVLMFSI